MAEIYHYYPRELEAVARFMERLDLAVQRLEEAPDSAERVESLTVEIKNYGRSFLVKLDPAMRCTRWELVDDGT